jgi:hypothetical protein
VLHLGDGGGCEGMRRRIFEASWGVTGWGIYRAFIKRGAQVFYDQIYLQFIPRSDDSLAFVKGGNSQFSFDSSEYSGAVTYRARPMVLFVSVAQCGSEGRVVGGGRQPACLWRDGGTRV